MTAITGELASALGVVCSELRWGDEQRVDLALDKLDAVAPALGPLVDPYSWLLVRLTAEFARRALTTSLRGAVRPIANRLGADGQAAFERYVRLAFRNKQSLTWPSQLRGIDKLAEQDSFALCTPTGSGKTRVAEVALLNGLFRERGGESRGAPLCLYIVPTRALAAEVEGKLGRVLRSAGGPRAVTVTGLYGGLDWGPSDEWLSIDEPTVLIGTQEKAEALVRFFGGALLERLELVIVDEAHEVQFGGSASELVRHESRPLRLETLITRLRARRPDADFIAVSAVARQLERPLARWISGGSESEAITVPYRSTRQVVGRLHCQANGRTRIDYDLLDGEPLDVMGRAEDGPYVPQPFPPMPPAPDLTGPQQRPAAYALWAALQLAGAEARGERAQSVLVSLSEGMPNFSGWWLKLLEDTWADQNLPPHFPAPTEGPRRELWVRALDTCRDLFGETSREYRLLERGVVVHHGRMPGRLPRLLTEVVEQQLVRIVLATSTLSQGVNLPVETVLVPRLTRYESGREARMTGREFANLIGRAGRAGVATEGQALVLLVDTETPARRRRARAHYDAVINEIAGASEPQGNADSALAALVQQVARLAPTADADALGEWLEITAPQYIDQESPEFDAAVALDALDAVILAAMHDSPHEDVEHQLRHFWRESFARYASAEEHELEEILVRRGRALDRSIYPEAAERRRYYKTSLPPRDAQALIDIQGALLDHLRRGSNYAEWQAEERFTYIVEAVRLVGQMPRFAVPQKPGAGQATWDDALRWWLRVPELERTPTISQVAQWHSFLQRQLRYRFTWGLGAVLAGALEVTDDANLMDWTAANVPWVAVWMKDLLQWGTLDPVAAYLLARGGIYTRDQAEELASEYYADHVAGTDPLDPTHVRAWALQRFPRRRESASRDLSFPATVGARVLRTNSNRTWRVLPRVRGRAIQWLDPAGFQLAESPDPSELDRATELRLDFVLDVDRLAVTGTPYI